MNLEETPAQLATKHNKDIFKITLLSSEYPNPDAEDEKEQERRLFSVAISGENEINYYLMYEEEYERLEKSIRKWIQRTFNRQNKGTKL